MKKLVYIHPSKLTNRWINYYCLDSLSEVYDLEYWDCSNISNPSFKAGNPAIRDYVTVVKTSSDFIDNLKRIPSNSLLVIDLHRSYKNLYLFSIIRQYFKSRVFINFFSNTQKSYGNKYIAKIMESSIGDIYALFRVRIMFNCFTISSAFGAAYRINHPDYEECIRNQHVEAIYKGRYIVYIDNYFPLHPEISQRNPSFDAKKLAKSFYLSLNQYFDRLEKEYSCRVVIAAHPSSDYSINPFDNRDIIYNQTCNLVKYSLKICMHTSNSISYVMLYNKPTILLSNNVFRQAKTEYRRLVATSRSMCLPIVDTDEDNNLHAFRQIDSAFASGYIKKYLIAIDNVPNQILFKQYFDTIYDLENKNI